MMSETDHTDLPILTNASDCWNRIGVLGDHSCPELTRYVHCRNCPMYVNAGSQLFEREPPAEWLTEQTNRLAEFDTPLASDAITVLIFRLAEEWLAFDVQSVIEVAETREPHRVPHRTSNHLEGIVNIRGELQLCVSLAKLLNLTLSPPASAAEKAQQRFLVAEHGRQRWVFPVAEVSGVHRLSLAQRTELPATVRRTSARLSRHVYDWNGKYVCHLDADRIFAALQKGLQ
jgi:chemotaxis-related protein WspD